MAFETSRIAVPVRKPFGLFATVISHGWYQTLPFRWHHDRQVLERAERLGDGRVMVLEIREQPSPRRAFREVVVDIAGDHASDPGVPEELGRRVTRMLRLDEDLAPFYAICRKRPALAKAIKYGAGRNLRGSSLWEDVVKTILGTNVLWKQAVAMINRLASLGDQSPRNSEMRAWPTPGQILRAGANYLRDQVRAGYRSDYVIELARMQKDGDIDLDALEAQAAKMTSDELFKALTAIKGVGKSSAHFLMNLLGHYDHIPVDSATQAYAKRVFFRGRKPTERQIRRRFEQFGEWQALVYWFGRWSARLAWWEDASGRATR